MAVYAARLDKVSSTLFYGGKAVPGSITSDPVWQIQKILLIGDDVEITWADGNGNFDNIWDDRLSLSYS